MACMAVILRRRVYWDACAFLGLINQELNKHADCLAVWNEAQEQRPRTLIHTSFWTYGEVFKAKCEGKARPLPVEQDIEIEKVLQQPWIIPAIVDEQIGVATRRLMRTFEQCKKPTDALHLATALRLNVDELHTYDGSDLLGLNGLVQRQDGKTLVICRPHPLPPLSEQSASGPGAAPLLDWLRESHDEKQDE